MFAWLKSHFFCFLLLICAQGWAIEYPDVRRGVRFRTIAVRRSPTLSGRSASPGDRYVDKKKFRPAGVRSRPIGTSVMSSDVGRHLNAIRRRPLIGNNPPNLGDVDIVGQMSGANCI